MAYYFMLVDGRSLILMYACLIYLNQFPGNGKLIKVL